SPPQFCRRHWCMEGCRAHPDRGTLHECVRASAEAGRCGEDLLRVDLLHLGRHSTRRACNGSIRLARHAEIETATNATRLRSSGIDTNTIGSLAGTPNRSPLIACARPSAP